MSRAHPLDFAYHHSMQIAPAQQTAPSPEASEGRDLAARLLCLKALIDAERDGFDVWPLPAKSALHS